MNGQKQLLISINEYNDRKTIIVSNKPNEKQLEILRRAGFRYNPTTRIWYANAVGGFLTAINALGGQVVVNNRKSRTNADRAVQSDSLSERLNFCPYKMCTVVEKNSAKAVAATIRGLLVFRFYELNISVTSDVKTITIKIKSGCYEKNGKCYMAIKEYFRKVADHYNQNKQFEIVIDDSAYEENEPTEKQKKEIEEFENK